MADLSYAAETHAAEGWILCRDPRLSRLLETELAYLGVPTSVYPTLPPPSEGICLVVADGDAFGDEVCLSLAAACACPLLVFGREERELPLAEAPADQPSAVFLRRPFALTALEKAVRRLLPHNPYPHPISDVAAAPTSPPRPVPPAFPALTVRDGVVTVGAHTVTLTPTEQTILEYLLSHAARTVTREELSALLEGGGNIVDVYVCRLRAKIEKPLGRRMIHTVRGVGYRWDVSE